MYFNDFFQNCVLLKVNFFHSLNITQLRHRFCNKRQTNLLHLSKLKTLKLNTFTYYVWYLKDVRLPFSFSMKPALCFMSEPFLYEHFSAAFLTPLPHNGYKIACSVHFHFRQVIFLIISSVLYPIQTTVLLSPSVIFGISL